MDCKHFQELIPLLQKDLLTGEEATAVRRHLEDCPDCREMERLESRISDTLDGMFRDLPQPVVPLPSRRKRSIFHLTPIRAGLATAAVVILAFILGLVLRHGRMDIQAVTVQSPVRGVQMMRAEFRAPVVRDAGDLAVTVNQLKKNVVWVSIQN